MEDSCCNKELRSYSHHPRKDFFHVLIDWILKDTLHILGNTPVFYSRISVVFCHIHKYPHSWQSIYGFIGAGIKLATQQTDWHERKVMYTKHSHHAMLESYFGTGWYNTKFGCTIIPIEFKFLSKTNVKQLVPVVYKLQQNLIKSARLVTRLAPSTGNEILDALRASPQLLRQFALSF